MIIRHIFDFIFMKIGSIFHKMIFISYSVQKWLEYGERLQFILQKIFSKFYIKSKKQRGFINVKRHHEKF